MSDTALAILERFRAGYGKDIDLTLRPAYRDLLDKLGSPHKGLPPVFHVAGTNGKGSTCAFLRAILEAAGFTVHVYTSPHLVHFCERIRVAGSLIRESELAAILHECEKLAQPGGVSYFEAATAAAFVAFAQHRADFTILETGLGGRLDATNVVEQPLATVISRLSYDHREYLGGTIEQIAREKAGIMRVGVPCFTSPQPDAGALQTLRDTAQSLGSVLSVGNVDWQVEENDAGFRFSDATGAWDLPHPALLGRHQYWNAGLAMAALSVLPNSLPADAFKAGMNNVEWPARLQRLTAGALVDVLPPQTELWLDGGHNDSAGEILAAQIETWRRQDGGSPRPLYVIIGMLTTKRPCEFLAPFAKDITRLCTVPVVEEQLSFSSENLTEEVRGLGIAAIFPMAGVRAALEGLAAHCEQDRPRILICGSLYLAGKVLAENVEH